MKRFHYMFLALLIKEAVNRFPKNVDLRILSAFVQRAKLSNEFKAIFELMNCEECGEPSLTERFTIFLRKVDIEQQLILDCDRNNSVGGNIDIKLIYRYERLS